MASTKIVVPGRPSFTVPGTLSLDAIQAAFGADMGLADMTSTRSSEYDDDGEEVTTFTFSHKTGGKG